MREMAMKVKSIFNLDKLGIFLSFVCALHCLLTPIIMMSLPLLARYYVAHPLFHWAIAALILARRFLAFYQGFQHHHKMTVFYLGVPGLLIISIVPTAFQDKSVFGQSQY